MIASKLIRSFYIIEAEGAVTSAVISGDFGIDKIILGSLDFDSDLNATAAMQAGINFILNNIQTDWDKTEESIDFNPEFFPSIEGDFHKRQNAQRDEFAMTMEEGMPDNQIAIPMTRVFDPMGDYVSSRWALSAPDFKICGKVGVNSDEYIKVKTEETLERRSHVLGPAEILRVH